MNVICYINYFFDFLVSCFFVVVLFLFLSYIILVVFFCFFFSPPLFFKTVSVMVVGVECNLVSSCLVPTTLVSLCFSGCVVRLLAPHTDFSPMGLVVNLVVRSAVVTNFTCSFK